MNEFDDPSPFFMGLDFAHPCFVLTEDVARNITNVTSIEKYEHITNQLVSSTSIRIDTKLLQLLSAKDLRTTFEFLEKNIYGYIILENCESVTDYDNAYRLLQSLMLIQGPIRPKAPVLCVRMSNALFNKVLTNVDVKIDRLILVKPLAPIDLKSVKIKNLCIVPRTTGYFAVEDVDATNLQELYLYSTDTRNTAANSKWHPPRWYKKLVNLRTVCLHPNATGTLMYPIETIFFANNQIEYLDLYWGQIVTCNNNNRPYANTTRLTGLRHNGAGHVPQTIKQLWLQSYSIPRFMNRNETFRVLPFVTNLGVAKIGVANRLMGNIMNLERLQYVAFADTQEEEFKLPLSTISLKWHAPTASPVKLSSETAHLTRVNLYCSFETTISLLETHAPTLTHVKIGLGMDAIQLQRLWQALCKIGGLTSLTVLRHPVDRLSYVTEYFKNCNAAVSKMTIFFVGSSMPSSTEVEQFKTARRRLQTLRWFETNAFALADPYNGICAYTDRNIAGCPKRLKGIRTYIDSKLSAT